MKQATNDEMTRCPSKKLRSYRVYTKDGSQFLSIVTSNHWTLKELNDLFQNGMAVVVVDQRSDLVNKNMVD